MSATEDKNIPPELKQSSTTITSNFLPASLRDLLRCPLLLLLGDICDVELGLLERQDSRLYVIACVVFLQESLRKKRLSQNLSGKNNVLPPIENPLSFEQMMLVNPDKSRNILKTIKKYLAKHFRRTNTASENKNLNFAAGDKYRAAYLLPHFYEDEINCIYKNKQKIANFDKLSSTNSSDSDSTKIKINCGTQTSKMQSSASTSVASLQNLSTQELMEQFILKLRENGEENGNRSNISTLSRKRNAEVQTSTETELNKKTSKMKIINKRISSSMSKILNSGRALNCLNVNLRKAFFTKRQMSKLSVCDADSTISDEESIKFYNYSYNASSKSVHSTLPRVVYQQRTL